MWEKDPSCYLDEIEKIKEKVAFRAFSSKKE